MSYFTLPRLAFSGQLQVDISTVNNDVRHFDNASFLPRFQDMQTATEWNGWFNPDGTGAFRLIDTRIVQALSAPGQTGAGDPALGLFINAQVERTAAKLVDLDPQFQMGSMIFGLRIVLTDGTHEYMRGNYHPSAFRDIYFGRSAGGGDGTASAKFTSILTDVEWQDIAQTSATLTALKAASQANGDCLAINLMGYGYSGATMLGRVTGSIGAWSAGQPQSFVAGRRMVVANGGMSTATKIGFFDAEVAGDTLSMDLSNAMPFAPGTLTQMANLGTVFAAVLKTGDTVTGMGTPAAQVTAGVREGDTVPAAQVQTLGQLNITAPNWLQTTGGIVDIALDATAQALIADHPLALVIQQANGSFQVAIRESHGGLHVRADNFELRLDPGTTTPASGSVPLKATQWGRPLEGALIGVQLQRQMSGGGGGPNEANPPTAPIPQVNFPDTAIQYSKSLRTGPGGWISNTFVANDPANPRGYIDGQLYNFDYFIAIAGRSRPPQNEIIILHVRNGFDVPANPDWNRDIKPFMQQYDNLYPIMSKGLFSLSDPAVARQHATLLAFSFERAMNDPNHMPATRDLSEGKRRAVLAWLDQNTAAAPLMAPLMAQAAAAPLPDAVPASDMPPLDPVPLEALKQMLDGVPPGDGGKTAAMREYLQQQIDAYGQEGSV